MEGYYSLGSIAAPTARRGGQFLQRFDLGDKIDTSVSKAVDRYTVYILVDLLSRHTCNMYMQGLVMYQWPSKFEVSDHSASVLT